MIVKRVMVSVSDSTHSASGIAMAASDDGGRTWRVPAKVIAALVKQAGIERGSAYAVGW